MDVKGCGLTPIRRFAKRATNYGIGKLSEIATTGGGQLIRKNPRRRQRKLSENPAVTPDEMRHPTRARISVPAPTDREEARVIAITFLDQNIEGPLASRN